MEWQYVNYLRWGFLPFANLFLGKSLILYQRGASMGSRIWMTGSHWGQSVNLYSIRVVDLYFFLKMVTIHHAMMI